MQTESTTGGIKVHKIIAGPFSNTEEPDFDPDFDVEYYWIDAMVEFDGKVMDTTIGHWDFDKIYQIVKHVQGPTIEPYILGDVKID